MSRIQRQGKKDSRQLSDVDSESEWESDVASLCDGPIELAPDPSMKFKEDKKEKRDQVNPQRNWEPENNINVFVNPQQTSNLPNHCQGFSGQYASSRNSESGHHQRVMVDNHKDKNVTKRSYHVSTVGEFGEESFEQQVVNEDGVQVLNNMSYKRKINLKRLEELKNEEELLPMKRKIATRFLLTLCHPTMTILREC